MAQVTTPTAERVAILQGGKVTIGRQVDATTARSVDAYVRAWASVRQDLVTAAAEAHRVAAATGNERSAAAYRTARLNKVLAELTAQLQRLGLRTGVQVTDVVPDVMAVPQQVLEDLDPAGLGGLNRVPARELEAIIRRQQEVIASKYLALSVEAEQSMRDALLRGVARGSGTTATARDMVRTAQAGAAKRLGINSAAELERAPAAIVAEVRDAFAGGMQRAQVLARTELIDASRVATTATYLAAPGVVAGWEWMATLDARTCGACWAMHGQVFAPDVHLEGHQQCRCVQSPLLHGERPGENGLQDAEAAFARLPRDKKLQVLGPKRLELVEQGRATLSDMAVRRDNPGWRAGHYVTPLDQLGGGAGPRRTPSLAPTPTPPRPAPATPASLFAPEQLAGALDPRRKRTTRAIVAELETTPAGRDLAGGIKAFTETRGGVTNLRKNVTATRAGTASPAVAARTQAVLDAVRTYPADQVPTLYRGIAVHVEQDTAAWWDAFEAQHAPGAKLNLNLSSFTSSERKAAEFERMVGGTRRVSSNYTAVRYVLENGQALPVEALSKFRAEREWISGGSYEVVASTRATKAQPYYRVVLRQTGTL